jgi:hypothetical protein
MAVDTGLLSGLLSHTPVPQWLLALMLLACLIRAMSRGMPPAANMRALF